MKLNSSKIMMIKKLHNGHFAVDSCACVSFSTLNIGRGGGGHYCCICGFWFMYSKSVGGVAQIRVCVFTRRKNLLSRPLLAT